MAFERIIKIFEPGGMVDRIPGAVPVAECEFSLGFLEGCKTATFTIPDEWAEGWQVWQGDWVEIQFSSEVRWWAGVVDSVEKVLDGGLRVRAQGFARQLRLSAYEVVDADTEFGLDTALDAVATVQALVQWIWDNVIEPGGELASATISAGAAVTLDRFRIPAKRTAAEVLSDLATMCGTAAWGVTADRVLYFLHETDVAETATWTVGVDVLSPMRQTQTAPVVGDLVIRGGPVVVAAETPGGAARELRAWRLRVRQTSVDAGARPRRWKLESPSIVTRTAAEFLAHGFFARYGIGVDESASPGLYRGEVNECSLIGQDNAVLLPWRDKVKVQSEGGGFAYEKIVGDMTVDFGVWPQISANLGWTYPTLTDDNPGNPLIEPDLDDDDWGVDADEVTPPDDDVWLPDDTVIDIGDNVTDTDEDDDDGDEDTREDDDNFTVPLDEIFPPRGLVVSLTPSIVIPSPGENFVFLAQLYNRGKETEGPRIYWTFFPGSGGSSSGSSTFSKIGRKLNIEQWASEAFNFVEAGLLQYYVRVLEDGTGYQQLPKSGYRFHLRVGAIGEASGGGISFNVIGAVCRDDE